jgi:hypothetical protein
MFKAIAIIVALIFGFDALTNFEQPKEETPVQQAKTSTYRAVSTTPKPSTTAVPTIEPEVVQQPVSNNVPTVQQPAPVSAPEPESVQQRLNRLSSSVGSLLPFVAGECHIPGLDPSTIRGCYYPGASVIQITQYATMYDDNYVMCIMRHEARHAWQYANGMFDIQNGIIVNRDWLEADATASSGCS